LEQRIADLTRVQCYLGARRRLTLHIPQHGGVGFDRHARALQVVFDPVVDFDRVGVQVGGVLGHQGIGHKHCRQQARNHHTIISDAWTVKLHSFISDA
jgi:hypothetical protein